MVVEDEPALCTRFSLWALPGRKTLRHDGRSLRLLCHTGTDQFRITLALNVAEGGAFSFQLAGDARRPAAWSAINRVAHFFVATASSPARSRACSRPARNALTHLRSLQALDGERSGASHREIAAVLFGAAAVAHRWSSDGELRAQVRHLVRRSHRLVAGGYRRLAGIESHGKGDAAIPSESP